MADGHQVAMALRAAYLSMHRRADAALQPLAITANQFVTLAVLAEEDGITQRVLVERTFSDPNTIRPILAALERKRFVIRSTHPGDRRARCVKITAAGRRALDDMRARSEAFRRKLVASLSRSEARTLVALLNRLVECVNESPEAPRATRPRQPRFSSAN